MSDEDDDAAKAFEEKLRADREQKQREVLADWVWVSEATCFVRLSDRRVWTDRQWRTHFAQLHPKGDVFNFVMRRGLVTKFERMTYEPGGPDVVDDALNLWRPSGIEAEKGDVDWFVEHVRFLFPGDAKAAEYVLDYMAMLVQEPWTKILFALLIYGKNHGTGKTMLARLLIRMLGARNVVSPSNEELTSQYTAWQEGAQLAVVNELLMLGRQQIANRLKNDITEPDLRIRAMYRVSYSTPNRLNYFTTSNHANALLLENEDRRWLVLHSTAEKADPEYYAGLVAHIDSDSDVAAVKWYLQHRKVSLNPKGAAPVTAAKQEMKEQSLPDAEAYVMELFNEGSWPFNFDLVRRDDLVIAVQRHLRGTHKDLLGRMTSLLKERIGAVPQKRATNMSGGRPSYQLWSVRNHEHWDAEGMAKRVDAYLAHHRMHQAVASFDED